MMDAKIKLEFDEEHVDRIVLKASEEILGAVAQRVLERAQTFIRDHNQIDTGFMVNSGYLTTRSGSTYGQAAEAERTLRTGQKSGRQAKGDRLEPETPLPEWATAEAGFAANYAIYQEADNPFLWPAAEATAAEVGGIALRIYKEPNDRP